MYSTYQELEDAVVQWTDREDIRPQVQQFIQLVTRQVSRQMRVPTMERTATTDVYADGSVVIPQDLVEAISVDWLVTHMEDIEGVETEVVDYRTTLTRGTIFEYKETQGKNIDEHNYTVEPKNFAREGSTYKLFPLPRSGYEEVVNEDGYTGTYTKVGRAEIHYFALPASLTNPDSSNWLLELAPEVYLYGALSHAYEYIRDLETAAFWNSRMETAIVEIQAWSLRADDAGGLHHVPLGG